jgi:excisionase family DNA binding protein
MANQNLSKSDARSNAIRVSVSEGAKLLGVNPATVRRAIKDQQIRYVVVRGRYKISFESLIKWSQKRPIVKYNLENKGIGQYIEKWKIKNTLFSPNPKFEE